MAAGPTYEPIATTTLGSAAASITFTGISQSYTDLVAVFNGQQTNTANLDIRVGNGSIDTAGNYSNTVLDGDGSSTYSASSVYANSTEIKVDYWAASADNDKMAIINFQNYSNTTTHKNAIIRTGAASREVVLIFGSWRSTSAINQIQILAAGAGNFKTGTTFTLYGIAAA